jgi:GNAT superfamily N-acetyltransferase
MGAISKLAVKAAKKALMDAPLAVERDMPLSKAKLLEQSLVLPKGVRALFEDYAPNEVELTDFSSKIKNKGFGSQAMENIVNAADKHGVDLMVVPSGTRKSSDRLIDFYGRFGFSEDGDVMRRAALSDPDMLKARGGRVSSFKVKR